jgi:hypothetical protein
MEPTSCGRIRNHAAAEAHNQQNRQASAATATRGKQAPQPTLRTGLLRTNGSHSRCGSISRCSIWAAWR